MKMELEMKQRNDDFLKRLTRAPRGLEKKVVAKYELDPYFNVISLEDLVLTLYQFARHGYLKYELTLSSEYLAWEEARTHAMLDASPLKPIDPFGALRRKKYRLAILDHEVKTDTPLSAAEISAVIGELPTDMAERFLRFKLSEIDQKKLREIVASHPGAPRRGPRVDNYYTVGYRGLIISGTDVTYKGKAIRLARQQQELLRVFLSRPEVTLSSDVFTENPEIFNPDKTYERPHQTLSQLIFGTHKILRQTVGECIFNKPREGWYLKIG